MKKSAVKRILFITLSNIGDVVLTFPVFDILKRDFPDAVIDVVVGPKAAGLFQFNSAVAGVIVYDKHSSFSQKRSWIKTVRQVRYDFIVDMRNSVLPFLLRSRKLPWPASFVKYQGHMKDKHLACLRRIYPVDFSAPVPRAVWKSGEKICETLESKVSMDGHDYVVVAAGAADHRKRWASPEGFAMVCDYISDYYQMKIVLVGDEKDVETVEKISGLMKKESIVLAGRLSLIEVAELLRKSFFALVHDSGVMHMASYLNIPTVALFGPTDPAVYGPWAKFTETVYQEPGDECLTKTEAVDVIRALNRLLKTNNL